jgi:hypothetical protein
MFNDSYCGGCECDCETFIGFEYKGAGGVINITYTTCDNFTGTIINIPLSTSANSGGSYSTFIFADSVQFEDQPAFCAKVGTPITHTDVSGGIGGFIPLFEGCCSTVNRCYSWTVNSGDIPSTLTVSYTNFEGVYIDQVEVLTQILVNDNIDGTFTYYLCSSTEPAFFNQDNEQISPPFTVEQGGNCNSDLQCAPNIPYTVYLVSDCCDEKPDGYMYLPVGLNADQVVGSSTDNTCYKIVEGAEAIENLDWDGSVFDPGGCEECQTTNEYFCDPEPPTQTPTPTQTQTPTPTITPTPTLTPTPTSQPTIIYFQRCCNVGQYLGVSNYYGSIVSEYSYLSITIGANTFCVKTVPSVPYPVTLYDFNDIELNGYASCEVCKDEHPCPPPPTQQIMGYENECGVITIFPMNIECVSISPSTTESNDGRVSVSITGGTPPYKYTWEGDNIGNDSHAPAIDNVSIGDYTVTVVDYWGDFTATTTCTLTAYTDCNFSGTVLEFTPPTQTPTPTPTPTPTSIPSQCDCRYGSVYISQTDIILSDDDIVYVSYLDCDGNCYCLTNGEIGGGKPYAEGVYTNDICIGKTTTTNSFDVSLYIIVEGEPQVLAANGDSYVTLGGCCTSQSITCVCYTVEWVLPDAEFWVGVTNFSYKDCDGNKIYTSVTEFGGTKNICARLNSILIDTSTNNDESLIAYESLENCCIPPLIPCVEYEVSGENTFINWTDCDGNPQSYELTVFEVYLLCALENTVTAPGATITLVGPCGGEVTCTEFTLASLFPQNITFNYIDCTAGSQSVTLNNSSTVVCAQSVTPPAPTSNQWSIMLGGDCTPAPI